jgi:hypothetical protein
VVSFLRIFAPYNILKCATFFLTSCRGRRKPLLWLLFALAACFFIQPFFVLSMVEELRNSLTVQYMLRGMEEMLQSKNSQYVDLQEFTTPLPQPPRTSGTVPGGEDNSMIIAGANSTPKNGMLSFKTATGIVTLALTDIICCRTLGKNTLLRHRSEQNRIVETVVFHLLADIEEHFAAYSAPPTPQFVRCHRSTVVSLAYCRGWQPIDCGLAVQMCEEMCEEGITVSRRRSKAFVEAFTRFYPPVR